MAGSYADARARLIAGETTCAALVAEAQTSIAAHASLNAFLSLCDDAADQARVVDARVQSGDVPPCAGMIVAVKDNISVARQRLTCASKILENFQAVYDATVIERLRDAGAIIVGKTNMDEFAMGSSNENSAFGAVRNPRNEACVPGGSSGGSVAAVAAGIVHAALGSETGGSVRQPAAMCGVVGVKPTYGRVSRWGLVAFASSLDQIGPVASTVDDAALVLGVIAGRDERDATSSAQPVEGYARGVNADVKGLRIGLPREYVGDAVQSDIRRAIANAAETLRAKGAVVTDISLPHTDYCVATYYVLTTAEASSNLARFDGVRYGFRAAQPEDVRDMYVRSRSEGFGAEVQRRIMLGTFVLSAGFYDAYYTKAQRMRRLIQDDFTIAFNSVDAILTPTTPTTAFRLGDKVNDPLAMYLNDIFTASANLAGVPAISVPVGNDTHGMPIGAQIITNTFDEATMFKVAAALEEHPRV